jgi:hypothetical protein
MQKIDVPQITFPDIPEEQQIDAPQKMDPPPIQSNQLLQSQQQQQKQQQPQQLNIANAMKMDTPPSEFEFNIDDNLSTQQMTSNVYKEKAPETQLTPPLPVFSQQPLQQMQKLQKLYNKPIFVSLMQVKRAMNNVETLYNDVTIAGDTIYRFYQLYTDMEQCYQQWQRTLDHLQEDMVDLDKALFRYS